LILDEPTSGVEPLVQIEVLDLIDEARDEGRTVFLSSHALSDVQRVADDIVVIRDGKVVDSGRLDDIRGAARQEFAVWFAGPAPDDELRQLSCVRDLQIRDREVRGVVEGDPNPLIGLLARHPVSHVVMPEPELEQAFLRYYEDGAR
jgi:ABC-2 type transport system ATP-binding protein